MKLYTIMMTETKVRYFKILNHDGSLFTYGMKDLDEKTLNDLENAFVKESDLSLFTNNNTLIVEVILDENDLVLQDHFPGNYSKVFWTLKLKTEKLTLSENESLISSQNNLRISFRNNAFDKIFTLFKEYHPIFTNKKMGIWSYVVFDPDKYLRDELGKLQDQLSEHIKNPDEKTISFISLEYSNRSENLEENIQRALFKMHKLLADFNIQFENEKFLVLKINNMLMQDPMSSYDEYLFVLEMFIYYLNEHPLVV